MRWLPIVALGALVLCGGCTGEPVVAPQPQPSVARDAGSPDAVAAVFVGVLTAAQTVDVAPRVGGLIARVHVGAGDHVEVDQVVAEMDPVPMREELRAAEAALAAAGSAVTKANVNVDDAKRKLVLETQYVEKGLSPAQNVEDARIAVRRAQADAEQVRGVYRVETVRVETLKANVTNTALRAPFAGTVAKRFRDAGNRVEAGAPIVKIVGDGSLRLRFAVPPQLANRVPVGARVTARVDTVAAPVGATVKQVTPSIDPASGMIIVEAELDRAGAELRPGLGATVAP